MSNWPRLDPARDHETLAILHLLALGIGLGAVAGVVFGYGVARLFSQSIRRLHVQIRAAACTAIPM